MRIITFISCLCIFGVTIEKDDKSVGEESDISDDDTGKRRFPIGSAGKY